MLPLLKSSLHLIITSYTRPSYRPRTASEALGALQGREENGPGPPRLIGPGALGPAGPGHGSPCGSPGSRRRRPRTPRHQGAFVGPQGAPSPFPSRPRLGTSGGPRSSGGPAALGDRGPPKGPRTPRPVPGPKGPGGPPVPRGPRSAGGLALSEGHTFKLFDTE